MSLGQRTVAASATIESDANLAAIRSAFERLNHRKPGALNEPTCGTDHATLWLRGPQWCAKRRSN
jgi:hypothetical protein